MIRITRLLHGKGTVSELIKRRKGSLSDVPSELLAFTEANRPLVFWNLTNRCNLLCSQCYINAKSGNSNNEELSTDEAKNFIDNLAEMKIPLLMFSGGEPLLRKDLWELASYAKSKGLKTALSSNGTLITKEIAAKIKKVSIEYVGISLDGVNQKTHDAIRGKPGSFKKSIQALKNCVDIGLKCGVRITATAENLNEILSLLDLTVKLKIPRFCLYWLVPSGRGRELSRSKNLEKSDVEQILEGLYEKTKELDPNEFEILTVDGPQDGIYIIKKMEKENLPGYRDALKLLQLTGDSCSAGIRIANVDPFGNVFVCQFAQLDELKIGNVRDRKFSEIWKDNNNPILSAFRNKIENLSGKCGECDHKELCGGGCRIRAYIQYNDLWAEDPLCPINE